MFSLDKAAWHLLLAIVATTHSLNANADLSKNEDLIRYRRAEMVVTKKHFENLSQMARGTVAFDARSAARSSTAIAMLNESLVDSYPAGSAEGDTKALPEIWNDWMRFKGMADKMQSAVMALQKARLSNAKELKKLLDDLGRSCKNCHDDFKRS